MMDRDGSMEGTARARVGTALGEFAVVATSRGLRSVTPLPPGAAMESEATSDAAGRVRAATVKAREDDAAHHVRATAEGDNAAARHVRGTADGDNAAARHVRAAAAALERYAEGHSAPYDGAFDLEASAFHLEVWERLRAIPFGATMTYGDIAKALGMPGEARAIGAAVAANPVCVLVPCHRVLGADGSLRGFAWGLDLKRRLLAHEGRGALSLFADANALSASPSAPRS